MRTLLSHLFVILLFAPALVRCQEIPDRSAAPTALASFPISTDGERLIVPVKIEDKSYRFLLDTGSAISIFNRAMPLGRLVKSMSGKGSGGEPATIEIREPPVATIGPFTLDCPDGVLVIDVKSFAATIGDDVDGLLGMDFLHRHIVQIDSDGGELRFFKKLPAEVGSGFHMASSKGKLPHLLVQIADSRDKLFALDTGYLSESGSLAPDEFTRLSSTGKLTIAGQGLSANTQGTRTMREGRVDKLVLGDFEVIAPVFEEGGSNKIGLRLLTRFVATIDFPSDKLYLNKGRRYAEADVWNLSGLAISRKDGDIVILSVEKDSVAARAGIEADSSIVKVDGRDGRKVPLAELHRLCCTPGKLSLSVKRLDKTVDVELELKH